MGEARRKRLNGQTEQPIDLQVVQNCAVAVVKFMLTASERIGSDCILHANLLGDLLQHAGIKNASKKIGYAAFRVGKGDGDCVAHHPNAVMFGPGNFNGHAWVEINNRTIVDATAWQLETKLRHMDMHDGRHSNCQLKNTFLILNKKTQCTSFANVRDAFGFAFSFEHRYEHEHRLVIEDTEAYQDDFNRLLFGYRNPDANIIGPFGSFIDGVLHREIDLQASAER